ncbi:MAG: DNA polymerase III subunit alpha [Lachnospiraceae bacterium]|nr:DNA polymerase III subunit alpha [Lachnospiraceae bacterium]
MAFTHLHVHTGYSLLDGSNKIDNYIAKIKELGMTSGAITDHGVMYGCMEFYKKCLEAGIKPILGCEVYVAPNSRFDRELTGGEDRYYHLILLAENNKGFSNLTKIVSKGFTEGFYYKPRVDFEVLNRYHEGIIALSACLAGEVQRYIVKGFYEEAKKCAIKYRDCFGENNYFLELQDHGIPEQSTVNNALLRMSHELNIPLVATNDVHYTNREDAASHDLLLCLQTGKKVTDEDRMKYEGDQFYVKSEMEMRELFTYASEAVDNTAVIADRCNVEIKFHETKLPHFDVPEGYTTESYLTELCEEGFKERYPNDDGTLHDQMMYELSVISKMGYIEYFLIVWDFINYAKHHDIPVGPGRGSAAGSIVAYALKITDIDPVKYDLFFERFLNPERVSMPDIDVDFCYEKRQRVIDYVRGKYGEGNVVQIVTFGTLKAKGVVRDIARVLDLPYAFGDSISKQVPDRIPNEKYVTLDKALEANPELRKMYETDENVKLVIDMSKQLEGLPRHASMHAAGVLICPEEADEFVPLSKSADGTVTTQYEMTTLEELGLLKMDFLGLRTLSVIADTLDNIKKNRGIDLDIDNIDLDDKAVYDFISKGHTSGVFQLESPGMQSFMTELKPTNIEDVIAGIALYRPGPMDFIPQYIRSKNDPEKIEYLCPELEHILKPTYGCIVYQEQVMQIVRDLAGFTMGRSDEVRRAMSKKKTLVLNKERENFVNGNAELGIAGCVGNGISPAKANEIYDRMIDFAKYAFNKAHAAAYAIVTYRTAFLKYYYPVEFMAALITSVIDAPAKANGYILEARDMGIKLAPPDINRGERGFSVKDDEIIYSLTAIKNVGRPIIDAIVKERQTNGEFTTIRDFLDRTSYMECIKEPEDTSEGPLITREGVSKRVVENFIKAGALDSFGATRKQLMTVYAPIMDSIQKTRTKSVQGQLSFFDIVSDDEKDQFDVVMPNVGEYDKGIVLAFEKEVLGVYVSGHPLDEYQKLWRKNITNVTIDFYRDPETEAVPLKDDAKVTIGGLVASKKIKYTKNNTVMAFLTIEDLAGSVEVILFPKQNERYGHLINEDAKVFITGRVSLEDNANAKLIAESVMLFSDMPVTVWLKFKNMEEYDAKIKDVYNAISDSEGPDGIVVYIEEGRQMKNLSKSVSISADAETIKALSEVLGEENVRVKE